MFAYIITLSNYISDMLLITFLTFLFFVICVDTID